MSRPDATHPIPAPSAGRRARTVSAVLGTLLFAAGLAGGWLAGIFGDGIRIDELNGPHGPAAALEGTVSRWLVLGVMLVSFVLWPAYAFWNRRATGAERTSGLTPGAIWFTAATLTLWQTARLWTAPAFHGSLVDVTGAPGSAWTPLGWLLASADGWLPALFAVIAALCIVTGVRRTIRRRSIVDPVAAVHRAGVRALGTVVDTVPATTGNVGTSHSGEVTIAFRDAADDERRVTTWSEFRHGEAPRVGTPVVVIYDADSPDDVARMSWSRGDGSTVTEFREHLVQGVAK